MKKRLPGPIRACRSFDLIPVSDGAHGAVIRAEVQRLTERDSTIGAVHATLERLERKGFVSSSMGEPTSQRGGKAKPHFKIEAAGAEALKNARATQERLYAGQPHAQVIVIPHANHFVYVSNKAEVLRAINAFVGNLPT